MPAPLVVLETLGPPGGPVLLVVVLVVVLLVVVLVVELLGGTVVAAVVGGAVLVGGTVVVGCRGSLLVFGTAVVEVVARLVHEATTSLRERVVVGAVEVAGESCWRCGNVVVVCDVASAACCGEVAMPTTLPPIAPISIAVATLTHRRVATNATGLKRRTPPVRVS